MNDQIIIDEEFKELIPPPTPKEYTQLERNILKAGRIKRPLTVWPQSDGKKILVDGHNRLAIFRAHPTLPQFDIEEEHFKDRDEAMVWIIDNQIGERNLQIADVIILEDKKREALARMAQKKIGGDKKSEEYQKSLQRNLGNDSDVTQSQKRRENTTDYKIAKAAGTSEDTVRRVRVINEKSTPETWEQVRTGKKSINKAFNEIKDDITIVEQLGTDDQKRRLNEGGKGNKPAEIVDEIKKEKDVYKEVTKKCTKCGKEYPLIYFEGSRNQCKYCREPVKHPDIHEKSTKDINDQFYGASDVKTTFEDVINEFMVNLDKMLSTMRMIFEIHKDVISGNESGVTKALKDADSKYQKMRGDIENEFGSKV